MLLDPKAPQVLSLTKFTDVVVIRVDAQERGAHFGFEMVRKLPNGGSTVTMPLDTFSGMFILLESAKQMVGLNLGEAGAELVAKAEALKLEVVAKLKEMQEAAALNQKG